ncbi:MAG: glycosyltransferase [Selenomonadaceae bacterium]
MLDLSACVIVKNEEKNLPEWINRMQKIANEIIVVDTGSTDKTISIAKEKGATVYNYKWQEDFSAAKNFALEKASGEWILFLDADEYFTDETIYNVPQYLNKINSDKNIDALLCQLLNVDEDTDNRVINVVQSVRIFRNDANICFQGKVHEFITRLDAPLKLAQMEAEVEIYHTGYSHKIVRGKLERNLQLLKKSIEENGEKSWHYPYLADCYYGLKEYDKAIEYANKTITANIIALGTESGIYRRLIDATALSGKSSREILAAIDLAIKQFPEMPEFLWNKGSVLFDQKDYINAEKYLWEALRLYDAQKNKKAMGAFDGQLNLLYLTFARISVLKNDVEKAFDWYLKSLREYAYNAFALRECYQLIRLQEPVDVIAFFRTIYGENQRDIQFIIKSICEYSFDKVYLYYVQMLQQKYNIAEQNILIAGLVAKIEYNTAIEQLTADITKEYIFMIISLLQCYDENNYQVAKTLLPNSYQKVLDDFLGRNSCSLTSEEKRIYQQVERLRCGINKNKEEKDIPRYITSGDFCDNWQGQFIMLLQAWEDQAFGTQEEAKILSMIFSYDITADQLYKIIGFKEGGKTERMVRLAAVLFQNANPDLAIDFIKVGYHNDSNNSDIIYTLGFLLHLSGDDMAAKKIIEESKDKTLDLMNLLADIDGYKK